MTFRELHPAARGLVGPEADHDLLGAAVRLSGDRAARAGWMIDSGVARLQEWAEAIGWEESGREFLTLNSHRKTAAAWPEGRRQSSASYSAHMELRDHPDRFKLIESGMTATEARTGA